MGRYVMEGPRWEHISPAAKDLIGKMLVKKPANRITAEAALSHPWLSAIEQHVSTQKLDPSVSGRGTYHSPVCSCADGLIGWKGTSLAVRGRCVAIAVQPSPCGLQCDRSCRLFADSAATPHSRWVPCDALLPFPWLGHG